MKVAQTQKSWLMSEGPLDTSQETASRCEIKSRRSDLPLVPSWLVTITTWAVETTRRRKVLKCTKLILSRRQTWAFVMCRTGETGSKERLSLLHHEDESASPCEQHADPAPTVVTALNEKNAGLPHFPPPFVSPLPELHPCSQVILLLGDSFFLHCYFNMSLLQDLLSVKGWHQTDKEKWQRLHKDVSEFCLF